jgi:hypothetical protein
MSHLNQALPLPVARAAEPAHRAVWSHVMSWLQRCWQSERRRAERPDRNVPYY